MTATMQKTVLVTGANGYIGNAVARAFVRAGWTTFGLVRRASSLQDLARDEIIPLLGSPSDHSFIESLHARTTALDVIVSATEDIFNYVPHYNDIIRLLCSLATHSNDAGTRPLVIFTSGCKDYGQTSVAGSPDLASHTEESPLNPPSFAIDRAKYAIKTFEHRDLFDAVVVRPTTVYGYNSSLYSILFKTAADATKKGVLELEADPNSIMHGLHVDDCGDAYVALAQHPDRETTINGQCFNISGWRYETTEEVAKALAEEYGIKNGVKFLVPKTCDGTDLAHMVIAFSQWVSSDKLRKVTGWRDRRQLFSQNMHAYRLAYDAAVAAEDEKVERVQRFFKS